MQEACHSIYISDCFHEITFHGLHVAINHGILKQNLELKVEK